MHRQHPFIKSILLMTACGFLLACEPTVRIAAPEKPITINLNIKIEHEIRIKVDKELDSLMDSDNGLF